MDIEEWIDWMRSRPDRKARQRRLFDALDIALPSWENVLVIPGFKIWANWRHPVIGKTRLDILKSLSLGNFDGKNTARLLNIAHQEIGANVDPVSISKNFMLEVNYAYMESNKNQRNEFFLIDVLDFSQLGDFLKIIEDDVAVISNVIGN